MERVPDTEKFPYELVRGNDVLGRCGIDLERNPFQNAEPDSAADIPSDLYCDLGMEWCVLVFVLMHYAV